MKLLHLFSIGFLLILFSCGDGDTDVAPCDDSTTVTIVDFTGLDGCSWVLSSDTGDQNLEPINLLEYVPDPFDGQIIKIRYQEKPDFASICLVGTIVEITCISD